MLHFNENNVRQVKKRFDIYDKIWKSPAMAISTKFEFVVYGNAFGYLREVKSQSTSSHLDYASFVACTLDSHPISLMNIEHRHVIVFIDSSPQLFFACKIFLLQFLYAVI